jgi:hypothetical protein
MWKSISDRPTDWSMRYLTDASGSRPGPGGLAVADVRHGPFNFARDVRVVGIWLEVATVSPTGAVSKPDSQFVALDAPHFTSSGVRVSTPAATTLPKSASVFRFLAGAADVLDFETYFRIGANHEGFALAVDWASAPALTAAWPNFELGALRVSQVFLFSRYSDKPGHEPTGAIKAARFHPVLSYAITPNVAVDKTKDWQRLDSIRFDWRLHLALDSYLSPAPSGEVPSTPKSPGTNAGLFKDRDSPSLSLHPADVLFEAAEKPVVLEVIAPAMGAGLPTWLVSTPPAPCWDNLHVWGARGAGKPMISTPGAFHCAHLHWRWGAVGDSLPGSGDLPVFKPAFVPPGVTGHGPLVDPGIWMQTVQVAVSRFDPALDPATAAPAALSKADFPTLFTGRKPVDIEAGADIVVWYSTLVHRNVSSAVTAAARKHWFRADEPATTTLHPAVAKLEGRLFIHGIFFAHEEEPSFAVKTGTRDPIHRPQSEAAIKARGAWFRPAN